MKYVRIFSTAFSHDWESHFKFVFQELPIYISPLGYWDFFLLIHWSSSHIKAIRPLSTRHVTHIVSVCCWAFDGLWYAFAMWEIKNFLCSKLFCFSFMPFGFPCHTIFKATKWNTTLPWVSFPWEFKMFSHPQDHIWSLYSNHLRDSSGNSWIECKQTTLLPS